MKTAIIVGSKGQDGTLLLDLLTKNNYNIVAVDKNYINSNGIDWAKTIDITSIQDVSYLIKSIKPSEVYFLAAFHHSSEDKPIDDYELFNQSYKINVLSLNNFLFAIKCFSPKTRLFYAASSLVFGESEAEIKDEKSHFNPNTVYGISKLDGLLTCRYYRNKYKIFASVGILFNHESHLRRDNFLSKKIIKGAINIKNQKQEKIIVGDIEAEIDWGYAPDYVYAMNKILNIEQADEFIVATGKKHSVKDFIKITFKYLNLDWEQYVEEDKSILSRINKSLVGDSSKLRKITGWKPSVSFKKMIKVLLEKEGDK